MSDQDNQADILSEEAGQTGLVLPGQNLPDKLYVIPIHNRPFFPAQVLPVIVNEEPWAETLELVAKTDHHCLALFYMEQQPGDADGLDPAGCAVSVRLIWWRSSTCAPVPIPATR